MQHDIRETGKHFDIHGDFQSAAPYGSGHINDTYAAVYDQSGRTVRYIHQRINHTIFKDPVSLMANIKRVVDHLHEKLVASGVSDISRRMLTLVLAEDGAPWYRDPEGNYWRTYLFIEKAKTYDKIASPDQATAAAKAFGEFQTLLADMPPPRLYETIPDFHNTRRRFEALVRAIESDACNRAKDARSEIEFAQNHENIVDVLLKLQQQGKIPERITHNDTKLNNVMIDDDTGEGVCVIDLDTVMPGLVLYDFGDMVRTATNTTNEDERDLGKVEMQMPMFEALVNGYLGAAGEFLEPAERDYLAFSGMLITFETGIRFLADYLAGDTYFKIHREGHNLDRCQTQFALVSDIESKLEEMQTIVQSKC